MDLSKPKALRVLETIFDSYRFTQLGLSKQAGTSFGEAHNVVKYLEERALVTKTSKQYEIKSYSGILNLFTAHRKFPKPDYEFTVETDRETTKRTLSGYGATLCLTTAWAFYDDYLRDPEIHAYLPKKTGELLTALATANNGKTTIKLYNPDLPYEPKEKNGIKITTETRTLIDLYSAHYAYGAENWINKKIEHAMKTK